MEAYTLDWQKGQLIQDRMQEANYKRISDKKIKKGVDISLCAQYSMYCSGQRNGENATVAQLVEYDLAKVGVAGSNPVCRS